MKNVLILGGAGFIGRNLSTYLVKHNCQVYCFDRCIGQKEADINYIQGDFFSEEDLKKAIKGMDCVVHAISTINPGNSNESYMEGYHRDFLQTIKLCDILLKEHIRLLFISSGGTVYGNHLDQPIREDSFTEPINHYGNVKLCIENAMRAFNYQMGADFLIARVSNPYGQGQNYHKGVGFIDAVLRNVINDHSIEIWGDGENIRDYVYIDDVCGMLECLINYKGKYNTFNVSSGIGISQNQIIDIVREMGYNPQLKYEDKRSVDLRKIVLNNDRIKNIWKKDPLDIKTGVKRYRDYLVNDYKEKKR